MQTIWYYLLLIIVITKFDSSFEVGNYRWDLNWSTTHPNKWIWTETLANCAKLMFVCDLVR